MKRVVGVAVLLVALAGGTTASAVTPRTTLTSVENDVMCVVCNQPLAVSRSPQADRERAFISDLIAKGYTKGQIENALVAQYGYAVLALPPAHGFNLTVYILPPAILLAGAAALAFALPRWRRRTRATVAAQAPALDSDDAQRLEDDLARHGP
jgi:cytochrome c-type biogenesis protein CcmH